MFNEHAWQPFVFGNKQQQPITPVQPLETPKREAFWTTQKLFMRITKVQKVHACEKTLDKAWTAVGSIDHALEVHKSSLLV